MRKYYFDTSIWIDLFENRNETNLPKGEMVQELINKIIKDNNKIIFSSLIIQELKDFGYQYPEIKELFIPFNKILIYYEPYKRLYGKARDLSLKREIPILDALHALLARDSKSILVTRDRHFQKLLDITKPKRPEEII
jgi:predicted nucleic acid-binding protein